MPASRRLTWLAPAIGAVVAGCVAQQGSGTAAAAPDFARCDKEAQRLAERVVVHAAPDDRAAAVATLDAGRFVYRCEERGEWLAVVFPAAGERVDCSQRAANAACRSGWVRRKVRLDVIG